MKVNDSLYSLLCLLLAFVALLIPTLRIDNSYTEKFDDFIFEFTNYKWIWASIDIMFVISIAIPFILLLLSIFFAVRSLKATQGQSQTQRVISVIMTTLSIGILVSVIGANIYLGLTI